MYLNFPTLLCYVPLLARCLPCLSYASDYATAWPPLLLLFSFVRCGY